MDEFQTAWLLQGTPLTKEGEVDLRAVRDGRVPEGLGLPGDEGRVDSLLSLRLDEERLDEEDFAPLDSNLHGTLLLIGEAATEDGTVKISILFEIWCD